MTITLLHSFYQLGSLCHWEELRVLEAMTPVELASNHKSVSWFIQTEMDKVEQTSVQGCQVVIFQL